jgi:hypothetical protein
MVIFARLKLDGIISFLDGHQLQRFGGDLAFSHFAADGEIDDGADKGHQGCKAPGGFFFDTAEIFSRDVDDGHAGQKPEQ